MGNSDIFLTNSPFSEIPGVRLRLVMWMWNVVFVKKLNVISQASYFLLFIGESKKGDEK